MYQWARQKRARYVMENPTYPATRPCVFPFIF